MDKSSELIIVCVLSLPLEDQWQPSEGQNLGIPLMTKYFIIFI